MKKLLAALVLGSTLTAAAYAQRPQTDRDFDGLKGPVKSLKVESAALKMQGKGYVEERRTLNEKVTYNAEGNRADDELYFGSDGALLVKNVYRYVGGERLADVQQRDPVIELPNSSMRVGGDMRPFSEKYRYKYDEQGRVKEMTVERGGRVRIRNTYEYRNGQMEMRAHKGGGNKVTFRRVDRFDAQGNLVGSTAFNLDLDGSVEQYSYTDYEFDARGNWVKRLVRESGGDGEPEWRSVEYRTITYF